jgi:hypothetical protein
VSVNGQVIEQVRATLPRPWLRDRGVEPAGRCGFEVRFPPAGATVDPASVRVRVVQSDEILVLPATARDENTQGRTRNNNEQSQARRGGGSHTGT